MLEAGQRGGDSQLQSSGQVPGAPLGGTRDPGPRPRSPEQSRRARGLATHNKKLMSAAACAAGSAVVRPRGEGGCGDQGRRGKERRGGGERRLFDGRNLFGFATSSSRQRGRKWEAQSWTHSLGGEGKGGGEKAAREQEKRRRAAEPGNPSPPPPESAVAPTPQTLARATRAHCASPAAAPGPSRSGHLCSPGPRPASALGPAGQPRPVS